MAKRRDWILRSVLTCCFLALIAAVLLFTQFILQLSILPGQPRLAEFSEISWLQNWDPFVLGLFLLLLALLLYMAARHRAVNNNQLRPSAGCPSCQESKLVRVSRRSGDRLLALSRIPMGRFVCSNCRWEGRRVIRSASSNGGSKTLPVLKDQLNKKDMSEIASFAAQSKAGQAAGKAVDVDASAETGEERAKQPPPQALELQGAQEAQEAQPDPLTSDEGYQLTDKWSNHVITVHARDSSHSAEPGEVVGTLHVQVWLRPGDETSLQAWLEHSTTTLTIYKRLQEAEKARK